MTNTLVVNGNTYTDDSNASTGMGNGGFRTRLLPMLSDTMVDVGRGLTTTSTTSLTIGTGTQVLTLATAIPLAVGAPVVISVTASPTNQMFGTVTARAGTTLTVSVASTSGSGSFSAWTIQISGAPGPTGVAASTSTPGVAALATQTEVNAGVEATKIVTSATLAGAVTGATVGLKNILINGDFRVVQRGASFSSPASGAYTLDRWRMNYDGTGAFTISQVLVGLSAAPAKYALNWNQSGSISGCTFRTLQQWIESVHNFAGQTVTLSFNAFIASGTISLGATMQQYFGTGGSPSSLVTTSGTPVTVDSSSSRYSMTISLPAITGKTLGSNVDDCLVASFSLPTTGTFNVSIWDVQLERGSVATSMERRAIALEAMLCFRYYSTKTVNVVNYCSTSSGGSIFHTPIAMVSFMRATPTVTLSGASNTNVTAASMTATPNGQADLACTVSTSQAYYAYTATVTFNAEI